MVILIKTNLREGKLSGGGALVIQAHPCWFGIVDHVLIIDMFVIMIIYAEWKFLDNKRDFLNLDE